MTASKTRRGFEAMVLPHLDAAYNLARWLTHNPDDAEDVVQEAYLRAFRYHAGFEGDDARSWLLTIVRNTCYTWLRNNRDRHEVSLLDDDQYDEDAAVGCGRGGDNPERLMIQSGDRALLNRLIGELPLPFRETLVLRELEELSYKEIAEITAVPIGTVMSRLARARRLLQRACVASPTGER